jgi:hypothetical protein
LSQTLLPTSWLLRVAVVVELILVEVAVPVDTVNLRDNL